MSIQFEVVEQAIVTRLQPLVDSGVKVEAFPDDINELGKPLTKGRVLVGFRGDRFSAPETANRSGVIIQEQTLEFEISIQLKALRTHTGVYPIANQVTELLAGYRPLDRPNDYPLYPVRRGFTGIDKDSRSFFYSLIFALQAKFSAR